MMPAFDSFRLRGSGRLKPPALFPAPALPGKLSCPQFRVADDCAVEFLAGSAASPQLEELDRIRAVSDSLPALGPHLAGALQGVVGLPVLLARRLLPSA